MNSSEVQLSFTNLHVDNSPLNDCWELLLRLVANFDIAVARDVIYHEQEFCVVEFGVQAIQWSRGLVHRDFVYHSMEAEESGLVFVRHIQRGWQIGSIHQSREGQPLPLPVLRSAIEDYWSRLCDAVRQQFQRDISPLLTLSARAAGILKRGLDR